MNVCSAGGIDYSRDKVQTSPVGDKLCKDVVRYTMFDQHINEEIDQFVDAKKQIIKEILQKCMCSLKQSRLLHRK